MRTIWLTLLYLVFQARYMVADGQTATPIPTPAATLPATFTPNIRNLRFNFSFRVSVGIPYDTSMDNKFIKQLTDAYEGYVGLDRIEIQRIHETGRNGAANTTCYYQAIYYANGSLATIKSDIINRVIPSIKSKSIFYKGTVYTFCVNEAEMRAIVVEAALHQNNTCKIKNFSPCPMEYSCVYGLYLSCIHRCQQGDDKLVCQNGGRCFVDVVANKTKCSCVETDTYLFGGKLCDEKIEKLALKSTYIIAIAAGGGGGIILLLLVLLIVTACKARAKTNKSNRYPNENGLVWTPLDGNDDATRNRSRLNVDAVSNKLYANPSELRLVGGRTHTVLKDNRGQEIYMYQPSADRPAPTDSRRSSTDVDVMATRPSSYHGSNYGPRELEFRRPVSRTEF